MTSTRLFAIVGAAVACLLAAPVAASASGPSVGRLLAPASVCPHQTQTGARTVVQLRAMRCMANYARARAGLERLTGSKPLMRAARRKAADILRCDEFDHEACGREFTYWPERFGYLEARCWATAENIAWGTGRVGGVRGIFRAWLRSAGHRENILGPYAEIGIGLRVGSLEGHPGAHVWVQQFGSHEC
jgi:uncharacterized protein YkwD